MSIYRKLRIGAGVILASVYLALSIVWLLGLPTIVFNPVVDGLIGGVFLVFTVIETQKTVTVAMSKKEVEA